MLHVQKAAAPFFLIGSLTLTQEKRLGRPWAPPKNCSTKGGGFGLKSFGGEVVEDKKMLFHTFFEVLMDDDKIAHLADCSQWQRFDEKHK